LDKPEVNRGSWGNGPNYIAVDKSCNIYVADIFNYRLQKFDSEGNFITDWYTQDLNYGSLDYVVKVDIDGNLYLFDSERYLQKFDSNGKFIKKWNIKNDRVVGLDIDERGYFFITDIYGYVYVFDPDGILIRKWSIYNDKFEKIEESAWGKSIVVDEKGNVFIDIADTPAKFEIVKPKYFFIFREDVRIVEGFGPGIVKYDAYGNYITKWLKKKFDDERVSIPMGRIATDFKGHIFMVDRASHCIQIFDSDGHFIAKFGSKGYKDGQFLYPEDVAVDPEGNVYVMDSGNFRIQKFSPNPDFKF